MSEGTTPRYCPFCNREFTAVGLVGQNESRERAAVDCPEHGEMEIEWSRREVDS